MSAMSLMAGNLLNEHSSGDTDSQSPGSVGEGVGTVDEEGLGWGGCSSCDGAVAALAASGQRSDGDRDGRWHADRGGCRCRGRCGHGAGLEVGGSNSADESRGNGEEAHCDYLLDIKKVVIIVGLLKKLRELARECCLRLVLKSELYSTNGRPKSGC